MPMVWDANADARLFAAFLATTDAKPDYPALAARMGNGCTPKAIIHRIAKIKSIANTTLTEANTNGTNTPASGKKRGKNTAGAGAVNGEDIESPVKKAKSATAKPKAKAPAPPALAEIVKEEEGVDETDATIVSD